MSNKPRPMTVAPDIAEQWAALDGGILTHTEREEIGDSLYPQLAPVIYDNDVATPIMVPLHLLPGRCPDCGGQPDLSQPDPLTFLHRDQRCDIAAEEAELERSDLRRLAKVSRHGLNRKHRIAAPVERQLIEGRGLTLPPGAFTTLLLLPDGRRARRWAELSHEPALQPRLAYR